MAETTRSRTSRRGLWAVALAALVAGPGSFVAEAQEQIREFTRPILVLSPGGHHAPVRALVFTPEGGQLLSGGLDKVVNVWGLRAARPTLEATIRPPIWRGPAGIIYALALSPTADERGQRVLAVAGFGVASSRGNIGLFHFPGANAVTTGDHFAQLLKDDPNDAGPTGHEDTVMCLAFDPRGTLLASGSIDATARIWDWKNRRTTAILRGHVGAINALAFTPDGTHLITGGRDGTLRLWDINRPGAPVASAPPPAWNAGDPLGVQINALAVSGDGRWVVIGREDGRLLRYDAATLANETTLSEDSGTIESLALSHDGTRLVTASIGRLMRPSDLPRLDCSIQVRRFPDGANRREILRLDNIAHACSFSPDDRTLAVAGGDQQAISLISNWDDARMRTVELKGQGRSIWDVGLRSDQGRLAVGLSHDPDQNPLHAQAGANRARSRYRGMILPGREPITYDAGDLSHALQAYEGWTIRPIDQFHLDVAPADRPERRFRIALDEVKDRRWWSYSFIPPGPQHPRPTVAVGCESGVWFYRLDDGRPTRLYAGHSGPVYCLAPSQDGRWLATGSSDQTVRLWTLAGCDDLPTLGAEFERRPDGSRVVTSVEPLGFAEAMGLRKGDVPVDFAIATKKVTADGFFARYEAQVPNTPVELVVRRKVDPPQGPPAEEEVPLGTTRRNGPTVSFFLGEDWEWVLWMPSGYYDTSIAGDTRFLGWHLNQSTILRPKPTDYLEIFKFEKSLRQPKRSQPNKLDTLLGTGDLALALSIPYPPAPLALALSLPWPAGPRLDIRREAAPPPDLRHRLPEPLPPLVLRLPVEPPSPVAPPPDERPGPTAAKPPAVPSPDLPAPAPVSPDARPPAGPQVAQTPAASPPLDIRPPASSVADIRPPVAPPLPPLALRVPEPQPDLPLLARPSLPDLVIQIPTRPQPDVQPPPTAQPQPPPITQIPATPRRDVLSPTPPPRTPLDIQPPATPPQLPPIARIPTAPEPLAPRPPRPELPPLIALQPPPLTPAEIVERGQPPRIEPRIQPLPNQQITTLEGRPIDPRDVPPEKIAIGDLDAEGKGTLMLDLTIDAQGRSPARSLEYRVDGRPIRPSTVFDRPITLHHEAVKLSLAPGPHRFTAEVENELGVKRTLSRDIFVRGLPRPTRPTRLKLLTIAPAFQEKLIPPIRFADRDAKDLRKFFARYLVSPEDGGALYSIDEEILEGTTATVERVTKAIASLKEESLGVGDLVVLVIESHFINVGAERRLVAADGLSIPPTPAVAADALARDLGEVAKQGCKVLVLIDGVHTASSKVWDTDITDWVRNLRDEQNVITFVASNSGPSQSLRVQGHRAFAQAVLDAVRPPLLKDGSYLLNDFRDIVIERVLGLTGRQQHAACYLPESINGHFPILNPQPTGR